MANFDGDGPFGRPLGPPGGARSVPWVKQHDSVVVIDASQPRSVVEVHLQNAHRSVPGRVAIFLARDQVVAVLSAMSFQRGRKQIMDLCIGQRNVPPLIRVEFDRNRLVTAMKEHVPSVRMSLHTLVMCDVQHGRTVALVP